MLPLCSFGFDLDAGWAFESIHALDLFEGQANTFRMKPLTASVTADIMPKNNFDF
jgi:hypothetical protein